MKQSKITMRNSKDKMKETKSKMKETKSKMRKLTNWFLSYDQPETKSKVNSKISFLKTKPKL